MKKRSVTLKGHRTSITLETEFWDSLNAIAAARKTSLQKIIEGVDSGRGNAGLSSALRIFILKNAKPE